MSFNVLNCFNSLVFKCQRDSDSDFETKPRVRVLVQMRGWRQGGGAQVDGLRFSGILDGIRYRFSDLETILGSGFN